jgi:hypothetical protein
MWTALFTVTIVAAIGFLLAAVWMSPQTGNTARLRKIACP